MTTDPSPPAHPPARSPDLPPVPKPPMASLLTRVYLALGGAAITFYLVAGVMGWDFRTTDHAAVPSTVRSAPGGYRTFHFWHTGYHGGK